MSVSLVTGGAGFIGSHVAQACLDRGDEVVVVDDLSGGYRENLPVGVRFVAADITSRSDIEALFDEHAFDFVYHLAAYAAEGLSHFIRGFNYTNNVVGTMNLVNASIRQGIRCFVFTSSIAVYGAGQVPMDESVQPRPEDPYGIAKYAVELDLAAAHRMFGLEYVVFRPHNVYGEGQNIADRYRNVIGIFMNQVMRGEPMSIFGDGEQTRAFTYVGDVAPVIARAVEVPAACGQTFNIGADTPQTVNRLAVIVAEAFDAKPDIVHLPARNEVVHAYASHERVREVFGQGPATSLDNGVACMAAWARQVGGREPVRFKGIEVEKNLPPSWAEVV